MCFGMFTCMMVPKATEEDTEFPDAGISGKCEPPDVVAGNRIQVLSSARISAALGAKPSLQ